MYDLKQLPNQKPAEPVVMFLRRQWFAWAAIIVAFAFMIAVPTGFAIFFWDRVGVWLQHPIFGPVITMFASMYVLCLWLFSFLEFTDYYLDTWVITNDRIINIEQKGLFNRVASELHLAAVQDVTSEVYGMVGTFFDFGDVYVQTAAEHERFEFKSIDHPEKVKEIINKMVEEYKETHAKNIVAAMADGTKTI